MSRTLSTDDYEYMRRAGFREIGLGLWSYCPKSDSDPYGDADLLVGHACDSGGYWTTSPHGGRFSSAIAATASLKLRGLIPT